MPIQAAHTQDNYFSLFGLSPSFFIDQALLDQYYYALLEQVHPDHFVEATLTEQTAATEATIRVNEAYHVLKSPFKRASYLLSLYSSHRIDEQAQDPLFLEEQIQLHQQVHHAIQAQSIEQLHQYKQNINQQLQQLYHDFHKYCTEENYASAAAILARAPYYERLMAQMESNLHRLKTEK